MLDLFELEQFVAFAEYGTLSQTAEKLHISQPTLTRTMKHIEEAFGVPLFIRRKNKISLNETGRKAAEYSATLLSNAENIIKKVQDFDQSLRTITVESCAPAPLWLILPELSSAFPKNTISSGLVPIDDIISDTLSGKCEIGIINKDISDPGLKCMSLIREDLYVCVSNSQELSKKDYISFADLNGFNCLLGSDIGFWNELCREKMPASKFLVQKDRFEFEELVKSSTLPCFATNLASYDNDVHKGRNIIRITDPEASVEYRIIFKNNANFVKIAEKLKKRYMKESLR